MNMQIAEQLARTLDGEVDTLNKVCEAVGQLHDADTAYCLADELMRFAVWLERRVDEVNGHLAKKFGPALLYPVEPCKEGPNGTRTDQGIAKRD